MRLWFPVILILASSGVNGQALQVLRIQIEGLHKTKEVAVLRELDFAAGDSIALADLTERLDRNRANLLNTALFTEVDFNISEWDNTNRQITVTIGVEEAWYLYVIPIIELADRNFNVWWQEHDHAFNRLNLGIYAHHINFTGIRDRLKFKLQVGYTQKLEINYILPYFDQSKKLGFIGNAFWSTNKEVAIYLQDNKQVFHRNENDSNVFRRFRLQAGLRYRPNLYTTHEFEASFHNNRIDEQIALDDNPDFFLKGKSGQTFFGLRYKSVFDNRDLQLFPMRGLLTGIEAKKEGLGIFGDVNNLDVSPFIEYHLPLTPIITLSLSAKAQYALIREKQPFWNYQGLGYGVDYLRGYELYVLNGLDYAYSKTNVKAKILDTELSFGKKMPRAFREMPVQVYLTANYDIGHVNDPYFNEGNPLVNRTLSGGGPGLTTVLYHTFAISVEYNFNELGENGLFLHSKTAF